ncbi:MAG TPA: helix-turn-helix domain-containing protein [Allosphingosinicella sp.]
MSSSTAQPRPTKKRSYRLGRRGDQAQATRRRIVEAAVDLHSSLGPARTTVSQIAERARVQRHTYYAHFPDDRSLFLACSGFALERDPLPDADQWREIPAGRQRTRQALEQLYGWYERNAGQAACVLRDAEHHALTREMVELRMRPAFEQAAQALSEGLPERAGPLLAVALDFACWRRLAETHDSAAAAALMADALYGVG